MRCSIALICVFMQNISQKSLLCVFMKNIPQKSLLCAFIQNISQKSLYKVITIFINKNNSFMKIISKPILLQFKKKKRKKIWCGTQTTSYNLTLQ